MGKSIVFIADGIAKEGMAEFAKFPQLETVVKTGLKPEELARQIADAEALVVRSATQATAEILRAGTRLKVVGRAGAGVDNIDVKAATERRILVLNTPGGNAEAAAELAIAMMFALARQLAAADASMKRGVWDKKSFQGMELLGKTLGLIGTGNVGGIVAARAAAMGMTVIASDPYLAPEKAAKLGVRMVGLPELYRSADFISIHAPRTEETRGMIHAAALASMKDGVILVNCARGGIVVEKDLIAALDSGKVRGAGVDVFEKEPPEDWALAKHPKVVAAPHLGATTGEAQVNVSVMIARQIGAYLTRGEILNAVNRI